MKLTPMLGIAAAASLLISAAANAQSAAGQVFLQVFNVGSPEESVGQGGQPFGGIIGSVGCGGTGPGGGDNGGADLIAVLNQALDTPGFDDSAVPLEQRRDLFRFCDNLTANDGLGTMGWDNQNGSGGENFSQQEGLAPDQLFSQTDQSASLTRIQVNNVAMRVKQMRLARRGLEDLGSYAFTRGDDETQSLQDSFGLHETQNVNDGEIFAQALKRGFSAGDGLFGIEGLSAFVNGEYTHVDADSSSREVGSDSDGGGFTVGMDKQLGENAFAGLAFGYSRLDTDYDHNLGDADLDDYTFSAYGSVFFDERFYADGIVTGSILRFDQTRKIPAALGPGFKDLDSEPDGWNITTDMGLGGEFKLEQLGPVELNPYLRVAVAYTDIDGFSEDGSSLALKVRSQDNTSVTSTLGMSTSLPLSTSFGVVAPYLRGEYVHEYNDQADNLRGNLAIVPQAGFKIRPNSTDRDYGTAGAGVAATFGEGLSAFADYDVLLGFSNLVVHQVTAGGRIEF